MRWRQVNAGSSVLLHHISDKPFVPSCLRVCDVGPASPPDGYAVASERLYACAFVLSEFLLCVSVPLWFNRWAGGHGDGDGHGSGAWETPPRYTGDR